jgi:ferredoxin
LKVTFITPQGDERQVEANAGQTLLDVARAHQIEIEGACGGAMACSTCHVIVDASWYGKLPAPSEDETDMLDLAVGITKTSRLGCQIRLTDNMDGLRVRLPETTHSLLG